MADTGNGVSVVAHRRTGSRLILSVCVRGKSSPGHRRQPAIRWFGPRVALAALTAASTLARSASGVSSSVPTRTASIRPGSRLDDHGVAQPRDPQRVLDVLGVHVEPVRQHDDVLDPAAQDEPTGIVELADVARPVPAVLGERRGGQLGRVPVAGEDGPAAELDLPAVAEAQLDPGRWPPDRPGTVVVERRAGPGPGLGRAVALQHGDPEVLPALLEGRRQERAGREEQPEVPAELGMDAREQASPQRERQVPGDAPQAVDERRPAALLDLAFDGAPEQVEDLRDDDHRRHPVIAQRIEDHPRVAAADVEDVGPDIERVVQPDRLLEQVRERQQRHDPVIHRRDDPVERLDRCGDVVVGEHHALRRAGRAAREDELEDLVRRRCAPRRLARLPVVREQRVVRLGFGGEVLDRGGREVRQAGLSADPGRRAPCRG